MRRGKFSITLMWMGTVLAVLCGLATAQQALDLDGHAVNPFAAASGKPVVLIFPRRELRWRTRKSGEWDATFRMSNELSPAHHPVWPPELHLRSDAGRPVFRPGFSAHLQSRRRAHRLSFLFHLPSSRRGCSVFAAELLRCEEACAPDCRRRPLAGHASLAS